MSLCLLRINMVWTLPVDADTTVKRAVAETFKFDGLHDYIGASGGSSSTWRELRDRSRDFRGSCR